MDIKKTMNGFVISKNGADLFYMRPRFEESTGALDIDVVKSQVITELTLTKTKNGYFRIKEGDTSTLVYCKIHGVPNPPCPCVKPCEGENKITESRVYRGVYGQGGKWRKKK